MLQLRCRDRHEELLEAQEEAHQLVIEIERRTGRHYSNAIAYTPQTELANH
jgi:hypothetical protein